MALSSRWPHPVYFGIGERLAVREGELTRTLRASFARSFLDVMPVCSPSPVAGGSTSDAPAGAAGSSTIGQVAEGRTMAGQVTGKGTALQEFEGQLHESRSASPLNSTERKRWNRR